MRGKSDSNPIGDYILEKAAESQARGDFLSALWDSFVTFFYAPSPYDPQVGDPFPGGDGLDGGLPPGGLVDTGGGEDGGGEGPGCFIGDTPVLMADGLTKPIRSIGPGDRVMARDEKTGATGAGAVVRTFRHSVAETLILRLESGEMVETTAVHRFAGLKGRFVGAGELRPGDSLSTHNGNEQGVRVISIEPRSAPATVYNLSVEQFQTFFVGNAELWVHNRKLSDPGL